jgi:L-lactate dehydrogenase complex protein LldG
MSSADARTAILARIRASQRTAYIPEMPTTPRTLEPQTASPEESLARFTQELGMLGVTSHVETTADAVRARVRSLIEGKKLLSWNGEHLPYDMAALLPAGTLYGRDPRDQQAQAEMGLAGVHGAIAETGSLVVRSGPGTSRTVTLLPPELVAVVRRDQLFFSMGELFRAHEKEMAAAACTIAITGPSRTADIELQLTLGVHGPGKVTVVVGP